MRRNRIMVAVALVGLAALLVWIVGCSLSTSQTFDMFSHDHTRHETNAAPPRR